MQSAISESPQNAAVNSSFIQTDNMKKTLFPIISTAVLSMAAIPAARSQDLKIKDVPAPVQTAFAKKYQPTSKVSWEKEKGNYEANWGGRSGEDNSAQFTPIGQFVELVKSIPVSSLPANVPAYTSAHYGGAKIKEAGSVTDAAGKHMYEAEIKGKDLIFDANGNFLREDK
jgi:hypothetical protein